jgi:hypothetical protein
VRSPEKVPEKSACANLKRASRCYHIEDHNGKPTEQSQLRGSPYLSGLHQELHRLAPVLQLHYEGHNLWMSPHWTSGTSGPKYRLNHQRAQTIEAYWHLPGVCPPGGTTSNASMLTTRSGSTASDSSFKHNQKNTAKKVYINFQDLMQRPNKKLHPQN